MSAPIEPENIAFPNVRAFFTTKNISKNNNDIKEVLAREYCVSKDDIYLPVQKHTSNIHILESDRNPVIADAVVTNHKNILIGVLVADCVPILMFDRNKEVIGAVHAGWRGTSKKILMNALNAMCSRFNSVPADILLAIGPSIRGCSYEVGEDVISEVKGATGEGDYYRRMHGKYFIDLSTANRIQALNMGVSPLNIWQSEECTFCSPHKYYSYRYSGGGTGRQGGFIGMW
ncbi:MAG: peptidoglycan editing factor PgeF [Nitrospirota bacterium]